MGIAHETGGRVPLPLDSERGKWHNLHTMKTMLSSLFALMLAVPGVVRAGDKATFSLNTSSYVIGENRVAGNPYFVDGQRGTFVVFEDEEVFPTSTSFSINENLPEGYQVSKWVLSTQIFGGGKTIQTWGATDSITIAFVYDWAKKYGTYLELTVYLKEITYTLSYSPKGGEWTAGEPEGGTYGYNDIVVAPGEESVERESYTLKGWKSNSGSLIAPGAEFSGEDLGNISSRVTLYAQWQAAKYKVTLNTNGGKVDRPLTEYEYGVGATLPKATKSGSEFLGWWDNPTFSGTNVTKISTTDRGDKEFWAQFSSGIHYNGNGATDGTMSDSAYVAGVPKALTKNAFSRVFTVTYDANGGTMEAKEDTAAYSFKNWNSEPSGQGAYTYNDGQDVVNPCGATSGTVTLYAQWQPESVAVTLPPAPKAPAGDPDFAGWFTAQSGGVRVGSAGDRYAPTWNTRLYAHWGSAKKNYTVKFSPGAEVTNPEAVKDIRGTEGGAITLPQCDYRNLASESGFAGWEWNGNTYEAGASFKYTPVNDGDVLLMRATWGGCGALSEALGLDNAVMTTTQSYTTEATGGISVSLNAGQSFRMKMAVEGPGKLTFRAKADAVGGLEIFSFKVGAEEYTEDISTEWKTLSYDVTGSVEQQIEWYMGVTRAPSGNKFYVDDVTWEPEEKEKCDITTSASGSGSASGGGTYDAGALVTLTATAAGGSTFVRWSDGSTDNPHVIEAVCDEEYQAIFSGGSGPSSKNYYILFDGNGADNMAAMDGQAMPCGGSAALTVNKFARSGFAFKGWATSRSGAVAYADQATVVDSATNPTPENATKTFYAVWAKSSTPTVLVTITGAKVEKQYTGKVITVKTSYTTVSSEKGYTSKDFEFIGDETVSGKEVGTYAMGLSSDDFVNLNEEYDVTFAVTDGSLVITKDEPGPGPEPGGDYVSTVGVAVMVDLASEYPDLKSVSGLPTGLKYNAKTGLVTGTPTRAYDEKAVTLKFTDKTTTKIYWTVEALPEMMIGTYYGAAAVCDGTAGQFQLKLAKTGKVTGSFYASGKKISFKATTLVEEDDETFGAVITYKYNKVTYEDCLLLRPAGYCGVVPLWEASLGETSEVLDDIRDARRDVIKEVYGKLKAGSFGIDDPELEMGEYLTAKVSTKGVVKVSGKLYSEGGKLTSVSSSSQLTVAEDGSLSCWITIYKKVGKETPIQYVYEWTMPEEN